MAEPINLNKARKAKARAAGRAQAAENRVRFGRTKAEKASAKAEAGREGRALDGAKRDETPEPVIPDGEADPGPRTPPAT